MKIEDIKLVIAGKEIEGIPSISYKEKSKSKTPVDSVVHSINVGSKENFIGILKNCGIELIFDENGKAVEYQNGGQFEVVDPNEMAYFAQNITKEEWDAGEFPRI